MFELNVNAGDFYSERLSHERELTQIRGQRQRLKTLRSLWLVLLFLLMGLIPLSARANITCNNLSGINQVLTAGTVSVPANTAPGTTIGTLAPITYTTQCRFLSSGLNNTSATGTYTFKTSTALAYGTDVYQTNIPGLGVRYIFNSTFCNANNVGLTNGTAAIACAYSGPLDGPYMPSSMTVTVQLVVTGPIHGGISNLTTSPLIVVTEVTTDNPTIWPFGNLYTGSASGAVTQSTCSVSQANTYVPLATANTKAFAAGAGTVFAPTPFSLTFACSAGAKVSVTLTDNVNPANRSNKLQLTADSSAKGIEIQVLNGSGPVSFGADSATPGNTNQWLIGDSPNGQLQLPLTARYVSTGAVSPGTVKALATFTMSYQ
jgi:type 1 fimbria pilin